MADVYNLREERNFPKGFSIPKHVDAVKTWLGNQHFKVEKKGDNLKGEKKGAHVNFVPKISVSFTAGSAGTHVSVHYFAKVKTGTGLAFGVLTGGLSTIIGAATFTSQLNDAKALMSTLLAYLEGISSAPSVLISRNGEVAANATPSDSSPSTGSTSPPSVALPSEVTKVSPQSANETKKESESPHSSDLKMISTEELEKRLNYHKEEAWRMEREIMERKRNLQS
eukprot:TRINITY_DN6004_c0_g1_i1.p1 TRINITY_DN6004_c0_g1~~TRINITY_DN6004_c0_g1_i1.p1  ORF type:complete len:225 (+),score=74.31 TRINITY_DN6004_c0_g1_i1:60-734(+)